MPVQRVLSADPQEWGEPLRYFLPLVIEPNSSLLPQDCALVALLPFIQGVDLLLAPVNGKSLHVQLVAVVLRLPVEQELHTLSCELELLDFFESDILFGRYDLSEAHSILKNR